MRPTAASGGTRCRLSVHVENVSVDVVAPAWLPVESLIPSMVDALAVRGGLVLGAVAARYQLSTLGGEILDGSKSLSQIGIRDGIPLVLTCSTRGVTAARSDDAAEAVAAAVASIDHGWTRRAAVLVGAVVAGCMAAVTTIVLIRVAYGADDGHRVGCVVVAATLGLAAVVACRTVAENGSGLALGLLATGSATLAGFFAVPGGPAAPNALFAAAGATTAAAMLRAVTSYVVVFTALGCFSATCVVAAVVSLVTAAPVQALGAGLSITSLALLEAAAPVSIMLTRLSMQAPPTSDESSPDPLLPRAIRAHTWLTSLVAASAATAALGAGGAALGPLLAGAPRLPGILLAALTGSALLLRSRAHRDIGRSVPLVIGGAATFGVVFLASAAAWPQYGPQIAALAALLAALAPVLASRSGAASSPAGRRVVELAECFSLATAVPLALWVSGSYSVARGLNLW